MHVVAAWRLLKIRILALLQSKTLLETKNRPLKCLKRHYLTLQSITNVADGGRGVCPLFSSPLRGIWQVKSPNPLWIMPGGQPGRVLKGGGGGLSAAGIHLCTLKKPRAFSVLSHVAIHLLNRKQKMGKLTFGNICIVIAYHFYGWKWKGNTWLLHICKSVWSSSRLRTRY